ncbi:MAG: GntR family transcriptional regulator [Azospirillaceae bacterium]
MSSGQGQEAGPKRQRTARAAGDKGGEAGGARVTPLYHRLYLVLGAKLRDGAFPPDRPMPSEMELARQFRMSRVTVRRALDQLEREKLIQRRRGSGTYPVAADSDGAASRTDIGGMLENLISLGDETEARLLDTTIAAAPRWARSMGYAEPKRTLRLTRLRSRKGEKFSLSVLSIPEELLDQADLDSLGSEPVISVLEKAGIYASTADQVLTVSIAEADVAEAMEVAVGSPLICMRRVVLDAGGRPILYQESLYPPDRYEYRMTLSRIAGGVSPRWVPVR